MRSLTPFIFGVFFGACVGYLIFGGSTSANLDFNFVFSLVGLLATVLAFLTASYFVFLAVDAYGYAKKSDKIFHDISEKYTVLERRVVNEEKDISAAREMIISMSSVIAEHFSDFAESVTFGSVEGRETIAPLVEDFDRLQAKIRLASSDNFDEKFVHLSKLIEYAHAEDLELVENILKENIEVPAAHALLKELWGKT